MKGTKTPQEKPGKVPGDFLESAVFSHLGAKRASVLVKPGLGLDNAVISLGRKDVLIATSDPLSLIPAIGPSKSAWLSLHLLASDLTTSGVAPQFAMLDFNLPMEMGLPAIGHYVKSYGDECKRLGIAIVGGHTGRYPGSGYTIVGGGTMFAIAGRQEYVTPAMASEGDFVVLTKGAAIGATAVLAHCFPSTIAKKTSPAILEKAKSRLRDCSTVEDALATASVGLRSKVTSMHDATEGGVLGGLFELSSACGLPVIADCNEIHVPEESAAVCAAFGLDPLTTVSEGTLIVTCKEDAVHEVRTALSRTGVSSSVVGRIGAETDGEGLWLSSRGSRPVPHVPAPDGYWDAYADAVRRGLE